MSDSKPGRITVTISAREMLKARYPDMYVAQKLREAGVPMIGSFTPQGVSQGRLVRKANPTAEDIVYEWSEK